MNQLGLSQLSLAPRYPITSTIRRSRGMGTSTIGAHSCAWRQISLTTAPQSFHGTTRIVSSTNCPIPANRRVSLFRLLVLHENTRIKLDISMLDKLSNVDVTCGWVNSNQYAQDCQYWEVLAI